MEEIGCMVKLEGVGFGGFLYLFYFNGMIYYFVVFFCYIKFK